MHEILVYDDYEIHKLGAGGGTQYEEVTTEKSTSIEVTDVAKRKGKLDIFGNTYQKQLTGKNLFNINSTPIKNSIVVSVSDNTLTQRNTGTYCRSAWKMENLIVGNEYTLSYDFINTSGCSLQARIMDSVNSSIIEQNAVTTETSGTSTLTFTATETTHYIRLYSNTLNTSITDTVIYNNIKLEQGSTATSFEPYCGRCSFTFTKFSTAY